MKRNRDYDNYDRYARAIGENARGEFTSLIAIAESLRIRIVVFGTVPAWDFDCHPDQANPYLPTIYLGLIAFWHYVSLRDPAYE